jgi:DNA-directed RNA polymerase specialized sigma24 family protein
MPEIMLTNAVQAEIAALLGIPLGKVKSRLHTAKQSVIS